MWIYLSDSFLSIVKPKGKKDVLLVRARIKKDIQRLFPDAEIIETLLSDYRYRAFLSVKEVADAVARQVRGIDYDNFKDSVGGRRHFIYLDVWRATRELK